MEKELNSKNRIEILRTLQERFENNMNRHKDMSWADILKRIEASDRKLWTLNQMELSGGEPDVVDFISASGEYVFIDCSKESPIGRRSLCYDRDAWESRKANKPENNAVDIAEKMGLSILTEAQYRQYHPLVNFDNKTSSWVLTPDEIRNLGGAIFCDYRFGRIFTFHNGAESYYNSRGFRGILLV